MTTIKDKILWLLSLGYSQTSISDATGIPQSSISKILSGHQEDVLYSKGKLIDGLVDKEKEQKQAA